MSDNRAPRRSARLHQYEDTRNYGWDSSVRNDDSGDDEFAGEERSTRTAAFADHPDSMNTGDHGFRHDSAGDAKQGMYPNLSNIRHRSNAPRRSGEFHHDGEYSHDEAPNPEFSDDDGYGQEGRFPPPLTKQHMYPDLGNMHQSYGRPTDDPYENMESPNGRRQQEPHNQSHYQSIDEQSFGESLWEGLTSSQCALTVIISFIIILAIGGFFYSNYYNSQSKLSRIDSSDSILIDLPPIMTTEAFAAIKQDLTKVLSTRFPAQTGQTTAVISAALRVTLTRPNRRQPACILVTSRDNPVGTHTASCLPKDIGRLLSGGRRSQTHSYGWTPDSFAEISGFAYASLSRTRDGQTDAEIKRAFDENVDNFLRDHAVQSSGPPTDCSSDSNAASCRPPVPVVFVQDIHRLAPSAALILHKYCDTDAAPHPRAVILLSLPISGFQPGTRVPPDASVVNAAAEQTLNAVWTSPSDGIGAEQISAVMARIGLSTVFLNEQENLPENC